MIRVINCFIHYTQAEPCGSEQGGRPLIKVTRLRAKEPELVINAELIETVEANPDTVITLTTGNRIIVKEDPDEIIRRVVAYRRSIHRP